MHIVKRGARGMDIVRDTADRRRFARLLFILNDVHQDTSRHILDGLEQEKRKSDLRLEDARPSYWPEREPLVAILAWTLMPNHFHLLLQEMREGGIAKFMQRLGASMSMAFNEKYDEQGSLFQGSYKAKLVDTDEYLRYVLAYVAVKNVLELYPGGLAKAMREYDRAWKWAIHTYPFSSLPALTGVDPSPILDVTHLDTLGLPGRNFKNDARDMLIGHVQTKDHYSAFMLEQW
jgi:putative transposase